MSGLLRAGLTRLVVLGALWWAVSEGSGTGWPLGVVVVVLAAGLSLWLRPPGAVRLRPRALPSFVGWFVVRSFLGGVDVARRALGRRVDVRPGTVEVPVRLPAGLPLVTLADAASLLPGTLAVELRPGALRLHVLDVEAPVARDVAELERRLAALFAPD